jgi:hypothetical protein
MYATKLMHMPPSIVVDRPFNVRVILRNDSLKDMQLTIDKKVYQSVNFFPSLKCGGEYIRWDSNEWRDENHEYEEFHLRMGDSLTYDLKMCLKSDGDSLVLKVDNYYKMTSFAKSTCKELTMDINGYWRPGEPLFLDSDEGYGFGVDGIPVIEETH